LAQGAFEYNLKGQDLLSKGKTAQAIAVLRKAVGEDSRNERSWSLLGRALAASGDPGGALVCYRRALAINPRDSLTRMMVEMLSQNPLPRPKDPKIEREARKGGGGSSELEKAADAERRAVMEGREAALAESKSTLRLVIDPGHGGGDFGCEAKDGLYEKQLSLDIGLKTAKALYAMCPNVEISLTRFGDYDVPGFARALCAALYGADLFVSIHASCSSDKNRNGMTVYSYADTPSDPEASETAGLEGRALALSGGAAAPGDRDDMAGKLIGRAQLKKRAGESGRIREALMSALPSAGPLGSVRQGEGPFGLLGAVDAPAVLIEAGMVSHSGDAETLSVAANRDRIAETLATALADVLGCAAAPGKASS